MNLIFDFYIHKPGEPVPSTDLIVWSAHRVLNISIPVPVPLEDKNEGMLLTVTLILLVSYKGIVNVSKFT